MRTHKAQLCQFQEVGFKLRTRQAVLPVQQWAALLVGTLDWWDLGSCHYRTRFSILILIRLINVPVSAH